MPDFARNALIAKLDRSGLLDRLASDVRILFHKRLEFRRERSGKSSGEVEVPLWVGAVQLGYLAIPESARPGRNEAYRRWLEMACRVFSEELSEVHSQGGEVLPASIRKASRLIRERYDQPLSLGQVADEVGLSRERLSRLFHDTLGITFSDYLNEVRLGEARRRLLDEGSPVTEIAYDSGFQSLSQFNRRFKSAEGMNPSSYRRRFSKVAG